MKIISIVSENQKRNFCSWSVFLSFHQPPSYQFLPLVQEEIERDLHRSLPEHPQFQTIAGIGSLRKVLFAYGARNPDIGYCQSMNIIGALLLCWMDETMAFWTLSVVVERLLVDYYCPSMKGIVIDQMV